MTNPLCILCNKKCENKFGNNPAPLRDDGRCCKRCNRNRVIPGRLLVVQINNIMEKVKKREKEAENKTDDERHKVLQMNSIIVQEKVMPLLTKLKGYA